MRPEVPGDRRTGWVETWWKTEARLAEDLWIYQRVKSVPHKPEFMWWADHEHCDWAWPTSRWSPGQSYRDIYGVRPPKAAEPGPYELVIGLIQNESGVGKSHAILEFQYR